MTNYYYLIKRCFLHLHHWQLIEKPLFLSIFVLLLRTYKLAGWLSDHHPLLHVLHYSVVMSYVSIPINGLTSFVFWVPLQQLPKRSSVKHRGSSSNGDVERSARHPGCFPGVSFFKRHKVFKTWHHFEYLCFSSVAQLCSRSKNLNIFRECIHSCISLRFAVYFNQHPSTDIHLH